MMLGSGAALYWAFDCNGNHFVGQDVENCVACQFVGKRHIYIEDIKDFTTFMLSGLKKDILVFSPDVNLCNKLI
jgi:hypothetical protein